MAAISSPTPSARPPARPITGRRKISSRTSPPGAASRWIVWRPSCAASSRGAKKRCSPTTTRPSRASVRARGATCWPSRIASSTRSSPPSRLLTEAQLADTSYPWLDGFPFWASVAGTFEHTLDHLADKCRERNDWPRAEHLLDRQAQGLLSLDGSDTMRAYVSLQPGRLLGDGRAARPRPPAAPRGARAGPEAHRRCSTEHQSRFPTQLTRVPIALPCTQRAGLIEAT